MNTTDILGSLPADLDWMVLFQLSAIRSWVDEPQMKAMFRLPAHLDLGPISHVVLTSQGRMVAPLDGFALLEPNEGNLRQISQPTETLLDRNRALFETFQPEEAACLAFGRSDPSPVLLHLVVRGGAGFAKAIFHREPTRHNYRLLRAIGVEYLGGHWTDTGFVALFRNLLSNHLHAALLSGYARAGNCNRFFLNHGEIDRKIESGLLQAAEDRIAWGKERGLTAIRELAEQACCGEMTMTCEPPPPRNSFACGDLVPIGFLLNALNQTSSCEIERARASLRDKLTSARQGALWSFHAKWLVTSIDSALVMQGLPDREGIEALERFSDGHGAYYPQLWSQHREGDRMAIRMANAHWCQADFAATCLVRGLRARFGLPTRTPLEYLERHFDARSSLFFANPYLTDWALASALAADPGAKKVKQRLREEILASRNHDHSFGTFDVGISTGFAILALALLGYRGQLVRDAQFCLLDMMDPVRGTWPESIPFYSTRRQARRSCYGRSADADTLAHSAQIIGVNGNCFELWLYRDAHSMVSTSVAVMALGEDCDVQRDDELPGQGLEVHPRYRCTSHAEYVAQFALSSYAGYEEEPGVAPGKHSNGP